MEIIEKEIAYQITNTYSILNKEDRYDKTVWIVCHGLGYLSRYFIKHFQHLSAKKHTIIAPQASAKYYSDNTFTKVGASWLTKENTKAEIQNVLSFLEEIYRVESIEKYNRFILLGFSQGVSIATRWAALRKIKPDKLILYAGKLPVELTESHFEHLKDTEIVNVLGTKDPFITEELMDQERDRLTMLFSHPILFKTFEGGHEVKPSIISELA